MGVVKFGFVSFFRALRCKDASKAVTRDSSSWTSFPFHPLSCVLFRTALVNCFVPNADFKKEVDVVSVFFLRRQQSTSLTYVSRRKTFPSTRVSCLSTVFRKKSHKTYVSGRLLRCCVGGLWHGMMEFRNGREKKKEKSDQ